MHELSITENILEIVLRHAKRAGEVRVTDLFLVIGELSSVVDDSVQFYWDFVSEGTVAEGAKLHFRRIPAIFSCRECAHEYPKNEALICPQCGSSKIAILSGREFSLEAIEVSSFEEWQPASASDQRADP
ncbi:MAG: hydrogenase maturation nickel metallochaperone HypA [Candidatus Promineifilaceae bacterium]|jgi:hydrogenase nickel incorporation protein HypA/HybF